jgi:transcription antitermination factor NusG
MANRKKRGDVNRNARGHKVARTWINKQRWRIHERPLSQSLPALPDGHGWHVARVMAGQEGGIADTLRDRGLAVFVPRYLRVFERDGKKREQEPVLVPGYVFIGWDGGAAGDAAVRSLEGVIDLLSCYDEKACELRPIRIPEPIMARFVREVSESAKPMPLQFVLRPGDGVKIAEGPLAGFKAVVERIERQHVVVTTAGRSVAVPVHNLEALTAID